MAVDTSLTSLASTHLYTPPRLPSHSHILTPPTHPHTSHPSPPTQYSRYEALIDAEDTDQDAIVQIMCKKAKWPPEVGCAVFDFAKLCIITKAKDRPPMNQVRLNTHTHSLKQTHIVLSDLCALTMPPIAHCTKCLPDRNTTRECVLQSE